MFFASFPTFCDHGLHCEEEKQHWVVVVLFQIPVDYGRNYIVYSGTTTARSSVEPGTMHDQLDARKE